ncbi:MAG: Rdx family protein [Deltaproteobacteria bacterium]|nr:Rdx family protein [Deltaproteobacteria bacterium]MBW2360006.1 Rdx family protein [Deltaproteobacteria bacterium]
MPQASSLAAAIQDSFDVKAKLIRGDNGIFDVSVDGKLIYSKHETGRFPETVEILDGLRS